MWLWRIIHGIKIKTRGLLGRLGSNSGICMHAFGDCIETKVQQARMSRRKRAYHSTHFSKNVPTSPQSAHSLPRHVFHSDLLQRSLPSQLLLNGDPSIHTNLIIHHSHLLHIPLPRRPLHKPEVSLILLDIVIPILGRSELDHKTVCESALCGRTPGKPLRGGGEDLKETWQGGGKGKAALSKREGGRAREGGRECMSVRAQNWREVEGRRMRVLLQRSCVFMRRRKGVGIL